MTSHSAVLPFAHKAVLSTAEKVSDLFEGSLADRRCESVVAAILGRIRKRTMERRKQA